MMPSAVGQNARDITYTTKSLLLPIGTTLSRTDLSALNVRSTHAFFVSNLLEPMVQSIKCDLCIPLMFSLYHGI